MAEGTTVQFTKSEGPNHGWLCAPNVQEKTGLGWEMLSHAGGHHLSLTDAYFHASTCVVSPCSSTLSPEVPGAGGREPFIAIAGLAPGLLERTLVKVLDIDREES